MLDIEQEATGDKKNNRGGGKEMGGSTVVR